MNKKLFGRDGRQAQLENLYREAEQGRAIADADPELQQAFVADQQLMQQIGRFASQNAPADPENDRAALLAAVVRKKRESPEEERRTMFGQFFGAKGLALLAAAGIFAGGAATVGASGGVSNAAGNANDVLATLHAPHKAHGHGNANGGNKPGDSDTPEAEGTQRAIQGIPTDNPQHHPADNDGVCDQGETVVKTTPSGVAVNVPCQAAEDHGQGNGDKTPGADKTRGANGHGNADKTRVPDETPEANETEPNEHADGGADHTPVALPTKANPHASEGRR